MPGCGLENKAISRGLWYELSCGRKWVQAQLQGLSHSEKMGVDSTAGRKVKVLLSTESKVGNRARHKGQFNCVSEALLAGKGVGLWSLVALLVQKEELQQQRLTVCGTSVSATRQK